MASRQGHRKRRPARAKPRPVRRRLLVVCEGDVTEREYILGLERHLRNAALQVEIPRRHGDPKFVVEAAKKLKDADAREARRLKDRPAFDEVWCVFDRDRHFHFEAACQMARDSNLGLAASNPCFELWLLLHFRESPGAQDHHTMQERVGAFVPGFKKSIGDWSRFAAGLADARVRAQRLDKAAEEEGKRHRNPTTGVYLLVASMETEGST